MQKYYTCDDNFWRAQCAFTPHPRKSLLHCLDFHLIYMLESPKEVIHKIFSNGGLVQPPQSPYSHHGPFKIVLYFKPFFHFPTGFHFWEWRVTTTFPLVICLDLPLPFGPTFLVLPKCCLTCQHLSHESCLPLQLVQSSHNRNNGILLCHLATLASTFYSNCFLSTLLLSLDAPPFFSYFFCFSSPQQLSYSQELTLFFFFLETTSYLLLNFFHFPYYLHFGFFLQR